jgi:hypothetical protein
MTGSIGRVNPGVFVKGRAALALVAFFGVGLTAYHLFTLKAARVA